ncbi:MAG: hypothetical protein M1837_002400 [Sclerophora amabilis]|nr:MAG: hypothetical protein M1837_002400 [Sclerophora amabilis]
MLKSTHQVQSTPQAPPLPPGWTEHKAPTGHSYYYNAALKQSTYNRPSESPLNYGPPSQTGPLGNPAQQGFYGSHSALGSSGISADFSGIAPTTAFPGSYPFDANRGQSHFHRGGRGRGDFRGGHGYQNRRRKDDFEDRPKSKSRLPGHEPWLLVKTRFGRRFIHNPDRGESFWKIPEDLKEAVEAFDASNSQDHESREQGMVGDAEVILDKEAKEEVPPTKDSDNPVVDDDDESGIEEDGDEYEDVTDEEDDEGNPMKRQKTLGEGADHPVEFNEDDIAFQLAAMGQSYGLDPGEYGNGEIEEEYEEGAEGLPLTEDDAAGLFNDLLDDYSVNPYSTWESVVEDGRIVEDGRYTVLPNMKSRKDVWSEWSRLKIQILKEQKEKEEKKDPRVPYLAFLQKMATLKLYWPEFRRKYKKEPEMRDPKLQDKEREKLYRDHISRLKLPESARKSDLSKLLKDLPLSALNRSSSLSSLPVALLTDIRYISVPPSTRDPLIDAYISTLEPAPLDLGDISAEDRGDTKRKEERERRERALAEREKRVAAEKRRQRSALELGRGRLREEEEEVARAMRIGKEGIRAQLGGSINLLEDEGDHVETS